MPGDYSRSTFRRENHYWKVLAQQGRPILDADLNEQIDIHAYHEKTLLGDIIGKCGTPDETGFKITKDASNTAGYKIGKGRYYVDGILCENDTENSTNLSQPDLLAPIGNNLPQMKTCLVYLDVYERELTALDDDRMREVALGGTDPTTRKKIVWQVKQVSLSQMTQSINCATALDFLLNDHMNVQNPGKMSAQLTRVQSSDPCDVQPQNNYTGLENQLYRIEIHRGGQIGDGKLSFKWSRNNCSDIAALIKIDGSKLTISNMGNRPNNFRKSQYVEITDDLHELAGNPGVIVQISEVTENQLTVLPVSDKQLAKHLDSDLTRLTTEFSSPLDPKNHTKVKGWDMDPDLTSWPLQIPVSVLDSTKATSDQTSDWLDVESGIQVQFSDGNAVFQTGDFWLIPARTMTRSIEWPPYKDGSQIQERQGIEHHYCNLALIDYDQNNKIKSITDCRKIFLSITDLTFLYYVGGDGQEGTPNQKLLSPLRVGVSRGGIPLQGVNIKFQIVPGTTSATSTGSLDPVNNVVVKNAVTDNDGMAQCTWTLGSDDVQQVSAQILNDDGQPVGPILYFHASTPYSFYYVSGDGQEGLVGNAIPLTAGVAKGNWPVSGMFVEFNIVTPGSGTGSLDPANKVVKKVVVTDSSGMAQCAWTLGSDLAQQVKAVLKDNPGNLINVPPLYFNANLATQNISANTGMVSLEITEQTGNQLLFGPFPHELHSITRPPAILLGLVTSGNDNGPVSSMEDYQYAIWNGQPVRFKAVNVNLNDFMIAVDILPQSGGT